MVVVGLNLVKVGSGRKGDQHFFLPRLNSTSSKSSGIASVVTVNPR